RFVTAGPDTIAAAAVPTVGRLAVGDRAGAQRAAEARTAAADTAGGTGPTGNTVVGAPGAGTSAAVAAPFAIDSPSRNRDTAWFPERNHTIPRQSRRRRRTVAFRRPDPGRGCPAAGHTVPDPCV